MAVYRKKKRTELERAEKSAISPRDMSEDMSSDDIDKVMSSAPEMNEEDMANFPQASDREYSIPNSSVKKMVQKIKPGYGKEDVSHISVRDTPDQYSENPNSEKNIRINQLMKSLYQARESGREGLAKKILEQIHELIPSRT